MISAIGTAATTSAIPTSTMPRLGPRRRASPTRSWRGRRTSATLANSDGCTEKPPGSTIQECAPLTVLPSGRQHGEQPEHRGDVDERRVGAQHPVVEAASSTAARASPMAMLSTLRLEVRPSGPTPRRAAAAGGRVDQHRADRQQREHRERKDPVKAPQHRLAVGSAVRRRPALAAPPSASSDSRTSQRSAPSPGRGTRRRRRRGRPRVAAARAGRSSPGRARRRGLEDDAVRADLRQLLRGLAVGSSAFVGSTVLPETPNSAS